MDSVLTPHGMFMSYICALHVSLLRVFDSAMKHFAQLTRDKLGMEQSGMWFQYKHRLEVPSQSWVASFQRHVNRTESRSH